MFPVLRPVVKPATRDFLVRLPLIKTAAVAGRKYNTPHSVQFSTEEMLVRGSVLTLIMLYKGQSKWDGRRDF